MQVHSAAAKAAVDSVTRTLALEWGSKGIKVNGVAPGPIRGTAGMAKLAPSDGPEEILSQEIAKTIPVGRMGERRDIALACVFLCSSAADWISGAKLLACLCSTMRTLCVWIRSGFGLDSVWKSGFGLCCIRAEWCLMLST